MPFLSPNQQCLNNEGKSIAFHGLVLSSTATTVDSARDLGVVFDSQLTMSFHVSSMCRSAYYQLRQLGPIIRLLSVDVAKMMVQAFVSSRLDYCNCLLFGIADGLIRRLQAVQNTAERLITGTLRRDHITPVLRQLQWLPLRRRVELAVLVFKALHGLALQYLVMTANSSLPLAAVNYDHPTHPHSSWRSIIRSRWTTSVQ